MKKVELTLYSFDELSQEAKEKAHAEWVKGQCPYCYEREARNTIKAFEREFGVKVPRWEYSSYSYDFHLDTSMIDDDVLALKGNRARAWFWNNHGDVLLTGRYYSKFHGTKHAHSKFFFDRVYDGTCPWTGYCMDCSALDPIAHFCFGVEWDEKEKRRVPSSRKLFVDDSHTVGSLLREGLDSLFSALKEDCEYQESMEAFAEACEANEYEFTADGEMWTGAKEVA